MLFVKSRTFLCFDFSFNGSWGKAESEVTRRYLGMLLAQLDGR